MDSSDNDAIENIIGRFGKYQTWILILITIGRYPTEFQLSNVVFILPSVDYNCLDDLLINTTNHCPCENPEYDQSTIISSVTNEWNLIRVCNRKNLASLAQSMMQVGILIGSLIYGYISDRFGRKNSVLLALFLEAVFVLISALVPQFWMFLVCRFLIGTAVGGTMLCCYILLIELSGKTFRPYLIGLHEISYITGYFMLPIIAYFVREWRHLQLITSVPWLLVIFYFLLIPESPRWLITVGKKKEAIDTLTFIANKNGLPTGNIEAIVTELEKELICDDKKKRGSYLDLFKTQKIRLYTITVAFIWMCCSHTFFGVNQYIGRLQENIYLNVMLSAACLAPGLVLVVFATLYLRRKISVVTSFSLAAISLLVIIFIPKQFDSVVLALAIIGQIGAYTSFVQIYLYTSEVFPTIIRNSAMGFASVFARVGAFIAPFVVNIGIKWISVVIFSGLAFCAALLCCLLPETRNRVLLNTIEQTEGSHKSGKNIYSTEL